jgi:hypothetical protein
MLLLTDTYLHCMLLLLAVRLIEVVAQMIEIKDRVLGKI